jgi:hypothetical protein
MAYALGCNDLPLQKVLPRIAHGTTVVALTGTHAGKDSFDDWLMVPIQGTRRYRQWRAHILYGGAHLPSGADVGATLGATLHR